MNLYCSFLVFNPDQKGLVESLCSEAGWTIQFIPDPSERFRFSRFGYNTIAQPIALNLSPRRADEKLGQLLVLETNQSEADNILQLICMAHVILEGFPTDQFRIGCAFEIPIDDPKRISIFRNVFQTSPFFEQFMHHTELPVAVAVAARAWSDRSLIYAIHKLSQSYATECITPWSTHPNHGEIFDKHSDLFMAHVRTSMAINLAFSAIEELQLQVKSDAKNKRFLDNAKGEWNPSVLNDLECRLRESGINPNEAI